MSQAIAHRPDLNARIGAINDVAKTARALLAALLIVAVSLAATMVAATDEALFRDAAKVFPSLSVEIRLSTAYALAPPVFLFLHLNTLLQLRLLARHIDDFKAELAALGLAQTDRRAWLEQIHGLAFAQAHAGIIDNRALRVLQAMVTWISMTGVPLALLLACQMSFVRYQNWTITIIHIACLAAGLGLLVWFHWPLARGKWGWRWIIVGALAGLVETISLTQALPPIYPYEPWNRLDQVAEVEGFAWTRRWLDMHGQVLIATDVKPDLLKPLLKDEADLRAAQAKMLTLSLPDRSFRKINLTKAELFEIDLHRADLRWANASEVQMRGANLEDAQMQGAFLSSAQMQGANLGSAQIQGAYLDSAQMQGAFLGYAQMQGVILRSAQMQGADLLLAQMQGADLHEAQMQGATFSHAQLQGASLMGANLSLASEKLEIDGCHGLDSGDAVTTGTDVTALQKLLEQAGLGKNLIANLMHRQKNKTQPICPDGTPLAGRKPDPLVFAAARRQTACASVDAASSIASFSADRATTRALTEPAGDDCPGLRDLGKRYPDARRRLIFRSAAARAQLGGTQKE